MLSIAVSQERLEADLAAGRVGCPDCSGRLSPWGFARSREDLVGTRVALANQLRAELKRFWPGAGVIFKDIDSPISLAFIKRYPNQGEISKCAYLIHLEEGKCDELGNWLRAERELTPVGERRFDVVAQVLGEVHLAHRGGNVGVPEQSLRAGEVLVAVVVADVGWATSATAPGR